MYERLERIAQSPATRICAPFVLGGSLLLVALSSDAPRALQAGGLVSLLAAAVLIREAGRLPEDLTEMRALARHLQAVAMHAALFAMSFLLASLGMGAFLPA